MVIKKYQKTFPQIDWAISPSGILLPKDIEDALESHWNGGEKEA